MLKFICFIYLVSMVSSGYEEIDEGSPCQQLGLAGICKRATDCIVAVIALKQGRRPDLLRCGFAGTEEVVCCPDVSDRQPALKTTTIDSLTIWGEDKTGKDKNTTSNGNVGRINTKRKCEQMCEKILKENNVKLEVEYHILNGEDAKIGQFPHMAALGYQEEDDSINWRRCGASLISSRFLLTAAHCIICSQCADNPPVKARFGVVDIRDDSSAQDVDIKNTFAHEEYDINSRHNDIALIELVINVRMSKVIYPACLYAEESDPTGLQVTGWGQTELNNAYSLSFILQYAKLQPVSVTQCNQTVLENYKNSSKVIARSQLCAISQSDSCQGDSGGPVQLPRRGGGYDIVGIVSYGLACGSKIPGIYTRVSSYLTWIEEKVWPT